MPRLIICRRRSREAAAQLRALRGDISLRTGAAWPREEPVSDQLWHSRPQAIYLPLISMFCSVVDSVADLDRDPGWNKFGSGIRDKHPESAALVVDMDSLNQDTDPDPAF
jgi:hypothetical protein